MSKKLRIIAIVLVTIAAGLVVYFALFNDRGAQKNAPAVEQQPAATVDSKKDNNKTEPAAGKYVEYSSEALVNTSGDRVLFFHAPWCPQCRELEASIKSGKIPENVTIFKVDYDTNQNLRQQHGVTLQTTVVLLDENGATAKKYVAYDEPSLDSVIRNLL